MIYNDFQGMSVDLIIKADKRISPLNIERQAYKACIYYRSSSKSFYAPNHNIFVIENKELPLNKYVFAHTKLLLNYDGSFYFYVESFTSNIPEKYELYFKKVLHDDFLYLDRLNKDKINEIFDKYKFGCLHKIQNDFNALNFISELNAEQREEVSHYINSFLAIGQLRTFLEQNQVNKELAFDIEDDFSNSNVFWSEPDDVAEIPYILTKYKVPFKKVDHIAYNENKSFKDFYRYNAMIVEYLKSLFIKGKFSISLKDFYAGLSDWLKENSGFEIKGGDKINLSYLNEVLQKMLDLKRLVLISAKSGEKVIRKVRSIKETKNFLLYLDDMFVTETNVLHKIQALLSESMPDFSEDLFDKALKEFEQQNDVKLSLEQKRILQTALRHKIFAITGDAGTGKSLVIAAYVYIFSKIFSKPDNKVLNKETKNNAFYEQVLCVSPTGKAAQNLSQRLSSKRCYTIHKAFNIIPGVSEKERFFSGDCLIIDEASMVDMGLLSNVIDHISDQTQLIFVGDINQLPPVNSGTPFLDLLKSKRIPFANLSVDFRQKEHGDLLALNEYILGKNSYVKFSKSLSKDVIFLEADNDDQIKKLYLKTINELKNKMSIKDILALTPKKKGGLGMYELNLALREIFNPQISSSKKHVKIEGTDYFLKDRVLQINNNYEDKDAPVMNGTFGTVVGFKYHSRLRSNPNARKYNLGLKIKFDNSDKIHIYDTPRSLESIDLGYVNTVHKSQGSEGSVVIFPISHSDFNMLNRSLLYTAATRAKDKIVFIGNRKLFDKSIQRVDSVRNLGLTLRLAKG